MHTCVHVYAMMCLASLLAGPQQPHFWQAGEGAIPWVFEAVKYGSTELGKKISLGPWVNYTHTHILFYFITKYCVSLM